MMAGVSNDISFAQSEPGALHEDAECFFVPYEDGGCQNAAEPDPPGQLSGGRLGSNLTLSVQLPAGTYALCVRAQTRRQRRLAADSEFTYYPALLLIVAHAPPSAPPPLAPSSPPSPGKASDTVTTMTIVIIIAGASLCSCWVILLNGQGVGRMVHQPTTNTANKPELSWADLRISDRVEEVHAGDATAAAEEMSDRANVREASDTEDPIAHSNIAPSSTSLVAAGPSRSRPGNYHAVRATLVDPNAIYYL